MQIDSTDSMEMLVAPPREMNFLSEAIYAFDLVDYLVYPFLILIFITILARRKKTIEPGAVVFRYGIFILVFGVLRLAVSLFGTLNQFSVLGMAPPDTLTRSLKEGMAIFCMYAGASLIPIGVSLFLRKSQPGEIVNASQPTGLSENHLHD